MTDMLSADGRIVRLREVTAEDAGSLLDLYHNSSDESRYKRFLYLSSAAVQEEVGEGDRAIDVIQFVEFSELNPLLFEKPYYLAPQKGGEKAYGVHRDALNDENRVGITRFYLRT
jgi:non-homologous end joining protein Ku